MSTNASGRSLEHDVMLATVGTIASLVGSLVIVGSFCIIPNLRRIPAFRLILIICLIDLYYELVGFFNIKSVATLESPNCEVFGPLAQNSTSLVYSWAFILAYTIYKFYKSKINHSVVISKYMPRFVLLSGSWSILSALIPLFLGVYGKSTFLCFVNYKNVSTLQHTILVLILYYIPNVFFVGSSIYMYSKILSSISKKKLDAETKASVYMLFFYPIAPFLNITLSIANRLLISAFGLEIQWLVHAQILFKQSFGFLNAVIFMCSPKIREQFRQRKRSSPVNDSQITTSASLSDIDSTKQAMQQYVEKQMEQQQQMQTSQVLNRPSNIHSSGRRSNYQPPNIAISSNQMVIMKDRKHSSIEDRF